MLELRPYQQAAIDATLEHWQRVRSVLICAPTGSGKSVLAEALIRDARARGQRVIAIAHRTVLVNQLAARFSVIEPVGRIDGEHEPDLDRPIQVATIQSLMARGTRPPADLFLWDESHHATATEWRPVLDAYPHARLAGLTATPERPGGEAMGDVFDELVVAARYPELVRDGFLVECKVFQPEKILDSGLAQNPVAAYERFAEGSRAFVFCRAVDEAYKWRAEYTMAGVRAEVIEADTDAADRARWLAAFDSGAVRVLVNVNCLDAETEVLTPGGWRTYATLKDSDAVAQWDAGAITFVKPSAIVKRSRAPGEHMVRLKGKRRDVRVTAQHRMLYRTFARGGFLTCAAEALVGRRLQVPISGYLTAAPTLACTIVQPKERNMPRAIASNAYALRQRCGLGHEESRRVASARLAQQAQLHYKEPEALSLSDCGLIGFWLGDGSRSRLRRGGVEYVLVQRTADVGVCSWIDGILRASGIHFLRRDNYARSNSTRWSLPRGTGFGPQRRPGVFALEPYLIKGGSPLFWRFNAQQVAALLHGFWMAEGNHGVDGAPPKGYRVENTDKTLLDLLQALASCHGYRTHLYQSHGARGRARALFALSWRAAAESHTTLHDRFFLEPEWRPELVWCATVPSGYLVTRRCGTVTIVGNCLTEGVDVPSARTCILACLPQHASGYLQRVGRVLRPHHEKPHAILVDLTGATLLHGMPTEDREYSLTGCAIRRTSEAPLRVCPKCGITCLSAQRTCPECGHTITVEQQFGVKIWNAELREVYAGAETPKDAKRREYRRLREWQRERGLPIYLVVKEYRKLFGEDCILHDATPQERGAELARLRAQAMKAGWKPKYVAVRFKQLFGTWPRGPV